MHKSILTLEVTPIVEILQRNIDGYIYVGHERGCDLIPIDDYQQCKKNGLLDIRQEALQELQNTILYIFDY